MNHNREIAKQLCSQGKLNESIEIYKSIYEKSKKIDCWLSWEYAYVLKKAEKIDDAIEVCKQYYRVNKNFKYINDLLSWCLFEKYFKNIEPIDDKKRQKCIKIGEFVTKITQQNDKLPYELIVWKIIKLYKSDINFNAKKINYWLNKLDSSKLSKEPYILVDKFNKKVENASKKEEWYSLKSKALIKLKEYIECIKICNLAMKDIKKFHYNNDIWIKTRKAKCIFILGNPECSIKTLEEILKEKEHWSIYKTLFEFEIKLNRTDKALTYAYIAALTKDPPKVKINLYHEIGHTLEKMGKKEIALKHYLFSKEIRENNNWIIPDLLTFDINRLINEVYIDEIDLYMQLKKFWIDEKRKLITQYEGVISNLLPNGKCGFIECNDGQSYYFKVSSIIENDSLLTINKKVTFSIRDSYDRKKRINTKEAFDIIC